MKLYAFMVGGTMPGANTELHDIFIATGESKKDCYESLRAQWWGLAKGLHVDCTIQLDHVDGYDVTLRQEPYKGREKLYFVNLGGYVKHDFNEAHKNLFVVAESQALARVKAIEVSDDVKTWSLPHKDYSYDADMMMPQTRKIELLKQVEKMREKDTQLQDTRWYIHLTRATERKPLQMIHSYTPIALRAEKQNNPTLKTPTIP